MANAGVNETGSFFNAQVVDGKPKKPNTVTLDVNINGAIYCTRVTTFPVVVRCPDEGLATSLALHYLELGRAASSDLKAIVVMGSMGEAYHNKLLSCLIPQLLSVLELHSHCPNVHCQQTRRTRVRSFCGSRGQGQEHSRARRPPLLQW